MYLKAGYGGGLGEDADVKGFDFNDQSIRKLFVRKVLYYFRYILITNIQCFIYYTQNSVE
ncbi:hypothetical protein KGM_208135 [Danaus plexippus plexippus]|uniref:Uncharacterized protein n=1 Tax=Danaus plexippus plexippus TaxID=278856 RepID=A0A212FNJ2_DANPL|nr:hypothetical protein KGM_208135 [Danaus plexippus plexippus]